jgi:hypothetical protein
MVYGKDGENEKYVLIFDRETPWHPQFGRLEEMYK